MTKFDEIFNSLNDKQKEAVLFNNENLLLIAGAGTGKTKTLVSKIIHLIKNNIFNEYQILGLTFSNNAAKEMKKRINDFFGEEKKNLYISTFHSLCVRILRNHAQLINLNNNFSIYDEYESEQLLKNILENDDDAPPIKKIANYIEKIKSYGYYLSYKEDPFKLKKEDLHYYFELYEKELAKNNALDFNGLITSVLQLLKQNKEVKEYYNNRYKYILVDEFQDTNYSQYELLKLMKGENSTICACGDDDQLLFSWRHADIKIILNFDKFFNAKIIKLEQNYRSHQNILTVANNIIEKNILRKGKKLWSAKKSDTKIYIKEYTNHTNEVFNISNHIKMLQNRGVDLNEVAILYRNNYQSRTIEEYLNRNSIPYKVFGGMKFFDRQEVKNILAFFKLIQNPYDRFALKKTIENATKGFGKKTIEKLMNEMGDISFFDCNGMNFNFFTKKQKEEFLKFQKIMEKLNNCFLSNNINDFFDELFFSTQIMTKLEENAEEEPYRIENVLELKSNLIEYSGQGLSLNNYLDQISLDKSNTNDNESNKSKVNLMTIHSAKGLEFEYVFLIGFEEGVFPNQMISNASLDDKEAERRLLYVAITRAKNFLYISYSKEKTIFGKHTYMEPSRFFYEIPLEMVNYKKNIVSEKFI